MNFLFVNAFISGNAIAHALVMQGHRCFHVYATKEDFNRKFIANVPGLYDRQYVYPDDALFENRYDAIIAGSDSGVLLANVLANDPAYLQNRKTLNPTSFCRTDRSQMQIRMGEACSTSDFYLFAAKYGKCVIKPRMSYGGCDRISIVNIGDDVDQLDAQGDLYITPFYEGTEYAVDFVSAGGQHRLCAVWRYVRDPDCEYWRTRIEFVPFEENPELIKRIYSYMHYALSLAEYKWGASHSEIMVSPNGRNIHLIECNWRNNGHLDYVSTRRAFEHSQIDLTAWVYANQTTWPEGTDLVHYKHREHICRVYFLNKKERHFSEIPWQRIENHPSVSYVFKHYRYFDTVPVSQKKDDLSAAHIVMRNADPVQLYRDADDLQEGLDVL